MAVNRKFEKRLVMRASPNRDCLISTFRAETKAAPASGTKNSNIAASLRRAARGGKNRSARAAGGRSGRLPAPRSKAGPEGWVALLAGIQSAVVGRANRFLSCAAMVGKLH